MANLVYICRQNVNRSPAAEIITKELASKKRYVGLNVSSAGAAEPLYPNIADEMKVALISLGYKPEKHKPRLASADLLEAANLILCMSQLQADWALERAPAKKGSIYTLPEYTGAAY